MGELPFMRTADTTRTHAHNISYWRLPYISLAPSMVDIPMKNNLYTEEAEYDPLLVGPASARWTCLIKVGCRLVAEHHRPFPKRTTAVWPFWWAGYTPPWCTAGYPNPPWCVAEFSLPRTLPRQQAPRAAGHVATAPCRHAWWGIVHLPRHAWWRSQTV